MPLHLSLNLTGFQYEAEGSTNKHKGSEETQEKEEMLQTKIDRREDKSLRRHVPAVLQ